MTSPCGPRRQPWRLKWDRLGQFRAFLDEGIWHIRKGYDHISVSAHVAIAGRRGSDWTACHLLAGRSRDGVYFAVKGPACCGHSTFKPLGVTCARPGQRECLPNYVASPPSLAVEGHPIPFGPRRHFQEAAQVGKSFDFGGHDGVFGRDVIAHGGGLIEKAERLTQPAVGELVPGYFPLPALCWSRPL